MGDTVGDTAWENTAHRSVRGEHARGERGSEAPAVWTHVALSMSMDENTVASECSIHTLTSTSPSATDTMCCSVKSTMLHGPVCPAKTHSSEPSYPSKMRTSPFAAPVTTLFHSEEMGRVRTMSRVTQSCARD